MPHLKQPGQRKSRVKPSEGQIPNPAQAESNENNNKRH